MSIYLDEKNPEKHKPFDDASPDIGAIWKSSQAKAPTQPSAITATCAISAAL